MQQKNRLKRGIMLGFAVFLMVVLAACGNTASSNQTNEKSGTDTLNGQSKSVATREYVDATGKKISIPANPQRVVTTQYLDAMLALGVKPVGAASHVLEGDYLKGKIDGIADIGNPTNVEKVLELQPDLIIATEDTSPEVREQLEKIAPTVAVSFGDGDVFKQLRDVAAVLGKDKEADQWIASFDKKAEEGRKKMAGKFKKDETITIYMTYGKDVLRVYGARNVGHVIYRSLELNPPEYIRQKLAKDPKYNFVYDSISMEKLPELSGDRIIMLVYDEATKDGMLKEIEQSALWRNLPAVKNHKVYFIKADPWFTYSPLAIDQSLDEAVNMFSVEPK
ncbi:iron complex transport system substrate-binding protein [Paenibacillus jamilae]|uniref:ABC transporter substrate-binding protein n=1 Tax=Paenibacillus TaxID=44249 RepID=UPI000D2F5CBB|nr:MULTISPECIES: ABC transporter substrate-binding protein [Paenibacillus]MDP9675551.1 iron complex transport system substrate-binding protein [Paenibacillus jamilae]KAF6616435.1 ABC transporter substrate-binding protein [Paenibacillus sp. EKM101P]KAF6623733.1 ABC transporter substrate-binding protein [Paenibacillus sp. EKM102P]KAF6633705.1 ABC transporter substrate-binding protein [Paenibacillus sp. EKM10P]KAF6649230.1 ABC transporter substrate-binding protein [Paenibacillus sp. EKM11P]